MADEHTGEPRAYASAVPGSANEALFTTLYGDLRRLAERQLRASPSSPLSATTLIHEAYINMSDIAASFPDRGRFMGYAARVMRGLIIDLVRERRAEKRGGAYHITHLPTEMNIAGPDEPGLVRLSDSLDELAKHAPRLAEVVDLKYFCGFKLEEIAAQLGKSVGTVKRDWEKARAVLFVLMTDEAQDA